MEDKNIVEKLKSEGYIQIVEGRLSNQAANKLNKEFEDKIKSVWDEIPEKERKSLQYYFELPKPEANYMYLALSGSYKSESLLDFFDTIFRFSNVKEGIDTKFIRLMTFDSQVAIPINSSNTNKSISLFCFIDPMPDLILQLPIIESWVSSNIESKLCICKQFVWNAVIQSLG